MSEKEGELLNELVIASAFMVMIEGTGEDCEMKRVSVGYCIEKIYIS